MRHTRELWIAEITELNKRSPELQPVTVPAFVVNEYNKLKLENDKLKEQLRLRPVSEKPEKKQEVLISYVDCYGHRINVLGSYVRRLVEEAGVTDDEDIMEYAEEKDEYYLAEGWYEHTTHSEYDCWLLHEKVDMWLPIPPAPEGGIV